MFEILDSADRLHLFIGEKLLEQEFSQMFNLFHSANRDRGITDLRGNNGFNIKIEGPSQYLPNAESFCDRPLRPWEAKIMFRRDVADMYGCINCRERRRRSNAIGTAFCEK